MGAPNRTAGPPPRAPKNADDGYLREMMRVASMRAGAQGRRPLPTVAPSGPAGGRGGRVALKTVQPSGTRAQNPERRAFFAEEEKHQAFMAKEEGMQRKRFFDEEAFYTEEQKRQRASIARKIKKAKSPAKKKQLTQMLEAVQRRGG